MDLGKILEATESVTFEFLGETNTAEVYTAGLSRLTAAQAQAFRDGGDLAVIQAAIPIIMKTWDVTWHGEPFTLEMLKEKDAEGNYVYQVPIAFANALQKAAEGVTQGRPTIASESPAGLQSEESPTSTEAIQ